MFDIEYKQEFSNIENKIKQNEIKQVEKLTNRSINAYLNTTKKYYMRLNHEG